MIISVIVRRLREGMRHDRIDDVVEPEMTRVFYVQVADDDFTEAPRSS